MKDEQVEELLRTAKTIAVVGLSSNRMRASFSVAEYLQQCGYRIIPINPNESEVLGEKSYASLLEVGERIDIVDIFRKSEEVPEVVQQAVQAGARCVWMQQGVLSEEGAQLARAAGLACMMDTCILKEHHRLIRTKVQPVS